jgi:hypothetical protein
MAEAGSWHRRGAQWPNHEAWEAWCLDVESDKPRDEEPIMQSKSDEDVVVVGTVPCRLISEAGNTGVKSPIQGQARGNKGRR